MGDYWMTIKKTREPLPLPTREEAVRFAIANTEIDGGVVTEETKRILQDWAVGKLTDEELLAEARNASVR
jgi:hypothetical protein